MDKVQRRLAIGLLVAAILLAGGGAAYAGVSDGNYRPAKQHCTGGADDSDQPDHVEPGCQSLTANLSDGAGHEALFAGTQQTADGENAGQLVSGGDPSTFDPTTGVAVYFGADDNLDSGEHDSSSQIQDGPSDGGAVVLNVLPASLARWLAALGAGDAAYLLTHPLPVVDAGFGSCADGICLSTQTQRRVAFQGGAAGSRDAANYDGKTWDPESCAGPSDTPADCNSPNGIIDWWNGEGTVYTEPGIQVYEDPNPEGSPIGPYPLPALYVGTCGLIAGGGGVAVPASPFTNSAGQLVVPTGC